MRRKVYDGCVGGIVGVCPLFLLLPFMTLQEIQAAVMAGQTVYWASTLYVVKYASAIDEFLIYCLSNDTCIGLTWQDGVTMNGSEDQFFVGY